MRRLGYSRAASVLGLAALIGLSPTSRVGAQHTPDPYNIVGEYNGGYESFMYPTYPNALNFSPNQGVLQGRSGLSGSNQFGNYLQDLDGYSGGDLLGRSSGRGGVEPYYRAHRQFDEAFNRVYSPNEAADKTYYKDQEARTKKYLEYLRESDPKKRAMLYREYTQQSLKSARDFSTASSRTAARTGASLPVQPSTASGLPRAITTPAPRSPARASSGLLPRPSTGLPSSASRPRGSASSAPAGAETPEQILERAELMERANRVTSPSRIPSSPAPR
jgi:hypothetical protein